MKSSYNPNTARGAGAVVISAIVLIGIYNLILGNLHTDNDIAATTGTSATVVRVSPASIATPLPTSTVTPVATAIATASDTPTPTATPTQSGYKDGTYNTTASYYVPHGETNSIKVTVTVKSGSISSVQVADNYADNESGRYISSFESSISNAVVGQKIDQVSVYRVGGASLTTTAFDQAISQIASTAKA